MKSLRWSAVPGALAVVIAILLALRIDTVMRRSKGWQGNGCIVGPYDPSERTYLWLLTLSAGITLLVTALIALAAKTAQLRVAMAIIAVPVLLMSTGYLMFVWTGGESTNRPNVISECSFG